MRGPCVLGNAPSYDRTGPAWFPEAALKQPSLERDAGPALKLPSMAKSSVAGRSTEHVMRFNARKRSASPMTEDLFANYRLTLAFLVL